jgi:hypothetical protein
MTRTWRTRLGTSLPVGVAALGMSDCGKTISAEAKVGAEFDCTFTAPEGDYVAHLKITKVDGSDVESKRT